MKLLFLDDNEARTEEIKSKFLFGNSEFDIIIATKTASKAIHYLKNDVFDVVSLDHDLGGNSYQDSDREDCGMEVVRWIVENNPTINSHIIVHSWNIPAAKEMETKLRDAGYSVERKMFGF